MKLLAIDTATELCSAALGTDAQVIYRDAFAPRSHTELILPMVDELLLEAGLSLRQLDGLVFDRGPGAFTGVRIGTSIVQGLALGADLPVAGVNSLAALAQGAQRLDQAQRVAAAIDARMGEVYWACYRLEAGIMQPLDELRVSTPARVATPGHDTYFGVGTGWDTYREELMDNPQVNVSDCHGTRYPHAMDLLSLGGRLIGEGRCCDPSAIEPEYVRNDVVGRKTAS